MPRLDADGRGHQWDTVFDANGNPLMVGLTVNGSYLDGYYAAWDDLDRLERKVDYAGNATLTQYNPLGHVSQITEADGYSIGFDRDPMGRVTGAYNQEGHRVSLSLDADGRVRNSTDPNNLTTQYEYHHATQDGRLKRATLPKVTGQTQGRAVEIAQYDGAGHPLKLNTIAADGTIRDSYRFYDELGRLTRSVGPQTSGVDVNRPVTCYVYSVLGDTKEIWAGSTADTVAKACTLDGINVRKQLSRTFDDFGRKLTETDALGNVWKWTWNLHNQLVASQTPVQIAAGQSTVYAWGSKGAAGETQGQLKSRTVPGSNGQTVLYTRDPLGLVTHAETRNGANQLVVAYDYAYDAAKRLRSVADSRPGMGIAKEITYTWTPGGRLALVEDSDGHMASMSYDATGRLASVVAPNGETISFTYDAGGRLVETRLNSGQRTTQSWFEDGNLKQKQNLFNGTVLSSHLYTLDQQGRRSGQIEVVNASSKSWSYLYDNLDRITSASDGTAETYGYDIYGNRRSKTKSGTTTAYLYDAAHQLSEIRNGSDTGTLIGAAVHDADGHMVKLCEVSTGGTITKPTGDCTASGTGATTLALVWNALDHLNTATRTGANAIAESYTYDDSGRRIQKVSGATTTSYLYDGDDIHAEWTGSISGNPAAAYVHGAGIDEPLLRLTGTTSSPAATQTAYLQDGLGSVVGLANTTGTLTANQRFDAWGNKTTSSGAIPQYGYTGREPDATGMEYYRARYYHPGLGRFASRDPIGMADAVSPYAYVANNPVNLIDPNGLLAQLTGTARPEAYWGMTADAGSWLSNARQSLSDAWQTSPAVATGNAFAGLAAVAVGKVTGNEALVNAGIEGMSENRQSNVNALLMLGTMGRSRGDLSGSGPVVLRAPPNATAQEIAQLKAYCSACNEALGAGALSASGRVSTSGTLRIQANNAAAVERSSAAASGKPYQGVAGHVPDTTWTGNAQPYQWLDLTPRLNSSLGGQTNGYPLGYKPTEFVIGK